MDLSSLVGALEQWASGRSDLCGIAIVGSHARGTARPDSDVDVVLVTTDAALYLEERAWLEEFGEVVAWRQEDWGAVRSVRTYYMDGAEIEFAITSTMWADVPVDEGTAGVIAGGFRIVSEREGLLSRLVIELSAQGRPTGEATRARGGALR